MNLNHDRIPNFFILGAPKAGTTSLFDYIKQHPEVFPSSHKETQFFFKEELYEKGHEFYLDRFFDGAENYLLKGECTPAYLSNPETVAPRIKNLLDSRSAKFIVILRDPVKRAWSNYLHRRRVFAEEKTFDRALKNEENRLKKDKSNFSCYYYVGLYGLHLSKWFEYFPKEDFLILNFDELKEDEKLLKKVFAFLGIDSSVSIKTDYKKNVASEARFRWLTRLKLNLPDIVGKIYRTIVPKHNEHKYRTRINRLLEKPIQGKEKPKMSSRIENKLRKKYKNDINLLEEILGRDFSKWK